MSEINWDELLRIVEHHWGFPTLRPLQKDAMSAVLQKRDSLVVLPTGGGKSLCYQAPAIYQGGTTVVVSPLIALMKDQVDSLQRCGVPAVQLDSSQSQADRFAHEMDIREGKIRLLFVSPERLALNDFTQLLKEIDVCAFAIDEAHCISHWGHDFRPEYRQLQQLREVFPEASMHAYTATATVQVREDIISQLHLHNPEVLVGDFDRQNLTYRVVPRSDAFTQIREVLDRHQGESGIIYCLRRADVDKFSAQLAAQGYRVRAYHAGLSPQERTEAQDAFSAEEIDLIVATVAFGMGIDRSNIRFVLHVAMPKSLEHYQQETGRAGRDGLEAECVLLFSGQDFITWKFIIEKSAEEAREAGERVDPSFVQSAIRHLDDMSRYCRGVSCRHRSLVEYFGQAYQKQSCEACDHCLGDSEQVPESLEIAQKILSCVARAQQRFGVGHICAVLRGENTAGIRKWNHEKLTTYGLLEGTPKNVIRDWIYQLIEQDVLVQTSDEYPILQLNDGSWEVLRGEREVRLIQIVKKKKKAKSVATEVSWEGVDRELFESLRGLRKQIANELQVRPYQVFGDAVLRELARIRPSTLEAMRQISGIGSVKLRDHGEVFLERVLEHSREHGLELDQKVKVQSRLMEPPKEKESHKEAFALFRAEVSLKQAAQILNLATSTVVGHLADWIRLEKPTSIETWVSEPTYQRVAQAARQVGMERLKPIYLALGEAVPYDAIRLVVAHLLAQQESSAS